MRISNVSFQGIKVTKQQQNINALKEIRSEQKKILTSCYEQLDLLEECANSIYKGLTLDGDIFVSDNSLKNIKDKEIQKEEYDKKRSELKQKVSMSDKIFDFSNRMLQAVRDAFEETDKADKKDAEIGISSLSYANSESKGIEKLAGYKDELGIIQKEFIDRVNAEKQGQDVDIFGSILFFGPYGNGKTSITKSVAEATDGKIIKIKHTSKTPAQQTMEKIKEAAKGSEEQFKTDRTRTIIFIDEADKLIGRKSTVSKEFEEFIKECSKKYHCSVFAATNNPLDLSVNMSDPDVFPIKMSIDPPNEENMEDVFKYYLKDKSVEDIDYKKIVEVAKEREKETDSKFSVGQIVEICENLHYKKKGKKITLDDVIAEISSMQPVITPSLNSKFENDYKELIEG